VGSEVTGWEAGRAIVLDDRLEHEAWNRAAERRVVLLFDFVP
jgi:aspartyl/asparaginyl beta-hydroxylase (cupin superfamily)